MKQRLGSLGHEEQERRGELFQVNVAGAKQVSDVQIRRQDQMSKPFLIRNSPATTEAIKDHHRAERKYRDQ